MIAYPRDAPLWQDRAAEARLDEGGDRRYRAGEPVTACYGSLTSFNVLFADATDQFRGAGGGESG